MPVVLSNGRSVAIRRADHLTNPSLAVGGGGSIDLLRSDADYSVTYEYVYRSQPFVFATINKLAYSAARNPLWFYLEDPDSETLERVRHHDAVRLMRKPAPRMSQFRWLGELFRSMYVHGHHLVWKDRVSGPGSSVQRLWPIPWTHVRVTQDDLGPVVYDITINGTTYQLLPQEVLHFQLLGGRSPLEVLRASIAMEDAAQVYQSYSLRNGVSPRAVFSASGMNPRAVDMLRAELRKLYAGPENAGNFVVANSDLNVKAIGTTPADLGLLPMREFSRQEVLSALDVPPPLVGLMENATLANVLEYRKAMHDAVKGKLIMVEQDIQVQLIDDEPAWDGLIAEINTDSWLLPDPETRAKMHMLNQQSSVNTINERRRAEKLPPIADPIADTVFIPQNMAPVGVAGESTAGTPAQGIADRIVSDTLVE
jgi:HK97 family phage portal protein